MCEMLFLKSEKRFSLGDVIPLAMEMERYGMAGFGWGIAWVNEGQIEHFRSEGKLQEERDLREKLSQESTTACFIHLRRPSMLSTIAVHNTQPYVSVSGDFAFGHNGFLEDTEKWAGELRDELTGESDSEYGFRLYQRLLDKGTSPQVAITQVVDHTVGSGTANVIVMSRNQTAYGIGRNRDNRLFSFKGNGFTGMVTELHSPDGTVFTKLFPWMTRIEQIVDCVEM